MAAAAPVGSNKYGMEAEFFTRGQIGDADTRGGSMVQKHLEKLQVEKENVSLGELSHLMPQFGAAVRVVALQETNWDVPTAAAMLGRFEKDYVEELKNIEKKRSKKSSKSKKKSKKGSKEKSKRKHSSKNKDKKHKKEKDRKRKSSGGKAKKEEKPTTFGGAENFGRFGLIKEADATNKHPNFTARLILNNLFAYQAKATNKHPEFTALLIPNNPFAY
eukprot:gene13141-3463_t